MPSEQNVESVRAFNRLYTARIGVLEDGLLQSPFSLTEVRVLYELAHRESALANVIGRALHLDAGYLSRILKGFERRGYVERQRSDSDRRSNVLSLTRAGREVFAPLDQRSHEEAAALLDTFAVPDQQRFLNSMSVIRRLLESSADTSQSSYTLRSHRPGDIGWTIERHGTLYADEFGWNEQFEALVAEILAKFIQDLQPEREQCWIAEYGGARAGCVFLVKQSDEIAQLRCLLVDPSARGLGLGKRLVDECVDFARDAGYERMMLWTNDVLVAARRIYEAAGFTLTKEERHHSFGHDLVGQNWELSLR